VGLTFTLVTLIVVFFTSEANALVLDQNIHVTSFSNPFVEFAQFGFLDDGRYNFTVEYQWTEGYNSSVLQLFICDQDQVQQYRRSAPIDECSRQQSLSRCFYALTLDNSKEVYHVAGNIERGASYLFMFVNCEYSSFDAKISGYLMNPNNSHTSTETEPLPILYGTFLGVWAVLFVCILVNGIQYRRFNIPLQRVLGLNALVKILSLAVQIKYFSDFNYFGFTETALTYCLWSALILKNFSKFTTIFLAAKGWCITRTFFQRREFRSLSLVILMVATNYSVYQILGGSFLWPYLFIFMVAMRYFFAALQTNAKILKVQLSLIEDLLQAQNENFDERHRQLLSAKIAMLRPLQFVIIFFIFAQIMRVMVNQFIMHHLLWVTAFIEEIGEELIVAVVFAIALRLRDFEAELVPQTLELDSSTETDSTEKPKKLTDHVLVIQNPGSISATNSCPQVTLATPDEAYFKLPDEKKDD
jgi:hypothetical protein